MKTKTQIIESLDALGIDTKKSWTKTRIIKIVDNHINQLNTVIDHHQKHAKSYFWSPASGASARRSEERRKSFVVIIGAFTYESDVRCSCNNYYYTGTFTVDDKKKNLTAARKLLKTLKNVGE